MAPPRSPDGGAGQWQEAPPGSAVGVAAAAAAASA
eukprot:CAMPEP_0181062772 /NCGR_PEP_ID=MMETSP1070-20121207/23258_1 /TAXON_ID=265543 /ORGANISM="Minutocellus polymorphus, Strain NH13" /LENGTH=34 /DNA_ID= /DNA_START= /DNA_END= /DNA_ORIENTATION=